MCFLLLFILYFGLIHSFEILIKCFHFSLKFPFPCSCTLRNIIITLIIRILKWRQRIQIFLRRKCIIISLDKSLFIIIDWAEHQSPQSCIGFKCQFLILLNFVALFNLFFMLVVFILPMRDPCIKFIKVRTIRRQRMPFFIF